MPNWIHPLLVQGEMSTDILEVLHFKKRFLPICVGSTDQPCPYLISRPLRQVLYGLLLPERDSGFPTEVAETNRVGLKLEETLLVPDFQISSENLSLDSLHKVSRRGDALYSSGFSPFIGYFASFFAKFPCCHIDEMKIGFS